MPESNQNQNKKNTSDIESRTTALVKQAKAGSKTAFGELANLFYEEIFRTVYYRTRNPMDAEDITQDIFLKAYKNLPKLKKAKRFRTWLFRITINQIRDFYRKKRILALFGTRFESHMIDESGSLNGDQPNALDNLLKEEFWKRVGSLSDKLSSMEREVFLLRFMNHFTIKTISQILKKSESSVKTYLYRALKKFRKESDLIDFLENNENKFSK